VERPPAGERGNRNKFQKIKSLDVFAEYIVFIYDNKGKEMKEEWKDYFEKRLGDFKEEIIHRFHVISEDVISKVQEVAEGVVNLDQKFDRRLDGLDRKIDEKIRMCSRLSSFLMQNSTGELPISKRSYRN
jgi:hypothetical protein